MDWKPKVRILVDRAESEPTKPSKPIAKGPAESSGGFVGATPGDFSKIEEPRGKTWAVWKAATLNRLFQEQGVTGEPGHITAATVLRGVTQVQRPPQLEKAANQGQNVHRGS